MKKRILVVTLSAVLVIGACIGLFFALQPKKSPVDVNTKAVYAFSAATSALYMNGGTAGSIGSAAVLDANLSPFSLTRPESIAEDIVNINKYLSSFESIIINGGLNQTVAKPTFEVDGEYANLYNIKMSAQLPTVTGQVNTFVMYYNEVTENNVELDEDDDENEVNTTLTGVMLLNGTEYTVSGQKSVENDDGEQEIEIEFETRSKANPDNYIRVKQEIEEDEISYSYSIYENGNLVSKTKVEYEYDEDDKEEELTISFKNTQGNSTSNTKYSFDKIKENGTTMFEVKARSNNKTEKFIVTIEGDQFRYTYSNGYTELLPRI